MHGKLTFDFLPVAGVPFLFEVDGPVPIKFMTPARQTTLQRVGNIRSDALPSKIITFTT